MTQQHMGVGTRRGYEWARAHGIVNLEYANGNSASFNEGVRLYAREQLRKLASIARDESTRQEI